MYKIIFVLINSVLISFVLLLNTNVQAQDTTFGEFGVMMGPKYVPPPLYKASMSLWLKDSLLERFNNDIDKQIKSQEYPFTEAKLAINKIDSLLIHFEKLPTEKRLKLLYSIKNRNYLNNYIKNIIDKILSHESTIKPSSDTKVIAINIIKKFDIENAIPLLNNALNDPSIDVKIEAIIALHHFGKTNGSNQMALELSREPWPIMKIKSIRALKTINTDNSIARLISMANIDSSSNYSPEDYICINAAIALACLNKNEIAFPVIKSYINNDQVYIRILALKGLALIGNKNSLIIIKSLKDDKDLYIKKQVNVIINKINN